jgi:hypothetical protein
VIPVALLLRIAPYAIAVAALVGFGAYGEKLYRDHLDDKRVIAEAQAEHDRLVAISDAREQQETDAMRLSEQYETQRQKSEAAYADARTKLQKSLQLPIACPAGQSLVLGDIVLSANDLAGLRAVSGSDRLPAPEPAASEPIR